MQTKDYNYNSIPGSQEDGVYKVMASQGHLGRACPLTTSPSSCLAGSSQQGATELPPDSGHS